MSAIGLGTWQLGADWGEVTGDTASEVISTSLAQGVNFLDTADVYGDGRSESVINKTLSTLDGARPFVATKMGRRVEQRPENYTPEAMRAWADGSRQNLGVDTIDLVQLHCPPTEVLASAQTWQTLNEMKDEGRIDAYGASVETCDQALIAMDNGASTIQITCNIFRRKPLEEVLPPPCHRAGRGHHRPSTAGVRLADRPLHP